MSKVYNYAQSLIATGMSPSQAILQSVMTIGATLPEKQEYDRQKALKERQTIAETRYKEAQAYAATTEADVSAKLAPSKIEAEKAKAKAETVKANYASQSK